MARRFDVERLVADLGGAANAAEAAGVIRTTPYGWIKRKYIGSTSLCRILDWAEANDRKINLMDYFVADGGTQA